MGIGAQWIRAAHQARSFTDECRNALKVFFADEEQNDAALLDKCDESYTTIMEHMTAAGALPIPAHVNTTPAAWASTWFKVRVTSLESLKLAVRTPQTLIALADPRATPRLSEHAPVALRVLGSHLSNGRLPSRHSRRTRDSLPTAHRATDPACDPCPNRHTR